MQEPEYQRPEDCMQPQGDREEKREKNKLENTLYVPTLVALHHVKVDFHMHIGFKLTAFSTCG